MGETGRRRSSVKWGSEKRWAEADAERDAAWAASSDVASKVWGAFRAREGGEKGAAAGGKVPLEAKVGAAFAGMIGGLAKDTKK